jgi:O-methyltransferase
MNDPVASISGADPTVDDVRRLYLDLMKSALTRYAFGETWQPYEPKRRTLRHLLFRAGNRVLDRKGLELVSRFTFDREARAEGIDWPPEAETMIGLRRLDNVEACVRDVVEQQVPGDLIETGVWRGGACIFMRAVLKVYGETGRTVWVADSFRGLPPPAAGRTDDIQNALHTVEFLAVSLERVRANFERYGLLDEQVRFLPGWFQDTLPTAPIERIAVMRLDGDMYDSTMVALQSLYPKLSLGGYVLVDDYALPGCRAAVDDFRTEHGVTDPLEYVDWTGRFWRRSS